MNKFSINLLTIKDIKDFVNLTNDFSNEVKVYSGQYIVDGKSIMGLFSLDLSKPVTVEIIGEINDKNLRLKELLSWIGE